MTEQEYRRTINLQRRLPDQIATAERRLEHLYTMAARLGLSTEPPHVRLAKAIERARAA